VLTLLQTCNAKNSLHTLAALYYLNSVLRPSQ